MGADLIVYICKGPQKLKPSATAMKKAISAVQRVSDLIAEWADLDAELATQVSEDRISSICKELGKLGIEDAIHQDFGMVEDFQTEDPETLVKDFVATWNDCDCRDMSYRTDPDDKKQKIVVAGELSWGDIPEGEGYTALNTASTLGLTTIFGIR